MADGYHNFADGTIIKYCTKVQYHTLIMVALKMTSLKANMVMFPSLAEQESYCCTVTLITCTNKTLEIKCWYYWVLLAEVVSLF